MDNHPVINLNELARYTDWLPLLIGLKEAGKTFSKTKESLKIEYEDEKWGRLFDYLNTIPEPSLKNADDFFKGANEDQCIYYKEKLILAKHQEVQDLYRKIIAQTLAPYDGKHIIELGSGYGTVILSEIFNSHVKNSILSAAEYTSSGIKSIEIIDEHKKRLKQIGYCDLFDLDLSGFDIEPGSVFFTSWVMGCIKGYPEKTLKEFMKYKPAAVIHIEPIFQHYQENDLLGMLWKKYLLMNDYNHSLLDDLKSYQAKYSINVEEVERNVFGSNPLIPVSVIKWTMNE